METTVNVLGDLHLRSDMWWGELAEKFLDWFEDEPMGGVLIQVGDITDKDMNPGETIDYVYRFAEICQRKFERTYLVVGNHDRKLYKGKEQYSFKFLRNLNNITIVSDPSVVKIGEVETLFLPYIRTKGVNIDQFYETGLEPQFYSDHYDLLVGHVGGREEGVMYGGVDLSRFHYDAASLGHIHSRQARSKYRDVYVGSMAPFKINEELPTDLPRVIRQYHKKAGSQIQTIGEIEIPRFISFDTVEFPQKIVEPEDGRIHLYTALNCKNLYKARVFYEGHHVRGVEKREKADEVEVVVGEKGRVFTSKREAFSSMIKETGMKISRPTHKYVIDLMADEV
jgi:DNA repair exonuclease SbcCD nuclease subunit